MFQKFFSFNLENLSWFLKLLRLRWRTTWTLTHRPRTLSNLPRPQKRKFADQTRGEIARGEIARGAHAGRERAKIHCGASLGELAVSEIEALKEVLTKRRLVRFVTHSPAPTPEALILSKALQMRMIRKLLLLFALDRPAEYVAHVFGKLPQRFCWPSGSYEKTRSAAVSDEKNGYSIMSSI